MIIGDLGAQDERRQEAREAVIEEEDKELRQELDDYVLKRTGLKVVKESCQSNEKDSWHKQSVKANFG